MRLQSRRFPSSRVWTPLKGRLPRLRRGSSNFTAGFTLVEVLIYIAIFAVVAGMLSTILVTVIRTQSRDAASNEVANQLDFVLTTVQRLVRDSSLIDLVYEGTSTSTACSTYCTIRLRMEDSTREPTIIRSDVSGVYLKEGAGDEVALTTDKIIVNSFSITKFETAGGHASAQIDASFSFNTNNPQLAVTKTLQSAISRVTAATFDSDLIPNTDGSWSLGQISPNLRWRDGYFSGVLSVGASVTEGSAILGLDSTTRGFLPPRMSTGQRDSIASPAAGLIIYNTTLNTFEGYDGTSWGELGGGLWTLTGTDIYRLSGNVGIGTMDPSYALDVRKSVTNGFSIGTGGDGGRIWTEYKNLGPAFIFYDYDDVGGGIYFRESPTTDDENNPEYEAFIVGKRGNIGIGTASPDAVLHLNTTNNTLLFKLTSDASAELVFEPQNNPNNRFMIQTYNGWLRIGNYTSGSYKETVSIVGSTGNFGIGTTNPSADLDVDGETSRGVIEIDGASGGCLKIRDTDDAGWTYCTAIDGVISCSTSAC